jgi:hypothetical protein
VYRQRNRFAHIPARPADAPILLSSLRFEEAIDRDESRTDLTRAWVVHNVVVATSGVMEFTRKRRLGSG